MRSVSKCVSAHTETVSKCVYSETEKLTQNVNATERVNENLATHHISVYGFAFLLYKILGHIIRYKNIECLLSYYICIDLIIVSLFN